MMKLQDNGSHEYSNGNAKTLSMSAKEYEEARSVKRKYEEVAVVTGEEDEQNVLQVRNFFLRFLLLKENVCILLVRL